MIFGHEMAGIVVGHGPHLLRGAEQALKRLKTDYIDVLQLHHFDAQTPVESVMSTLDDLVRQQLRDRLAFEPDLPAPRMQGILRLLRAQAAPPRALRATAA